MVKIKIFPAVAAFDPSVHKEIVEPHAWISVADTASLSRRLPKNNWRADEIYLRFDDVEHDMWLGKQKLATAIVPHQSLLIAGFVLKWKHLPLIVVNCEAGISRSAAIGAAIQTHLTGKSDILVDRRYRPNGLVFKSVARALQEEAAYIEKIH